MQLSRAYATCHNKGQLDRGRGGGVAGVRRHASWTLINEKKREKKTGSACHEETRCRGAEVRNVGKVAEARGGRGRRERER